MKNNIDHDSVKADVVIKKHVELMSHLVCDNDSGKIIGNIYLTDSQAYQLNKIMKSIDGKQHIAFIQV